MDRVVRYCVWPCGLIFLLLVISGCASSYHEPARSDKQAASLDAMVPVWVVSIDGQKVSSFSAFGHKELRVAPGVHVVEVQYYDKMDLAPRRLYYVSTNNVRVQFTALPGSRYRVKGGEMGNRCSPYVTDTLEPVFSDPKLN